MPPEPDPYRNQRDAVTRHYDARAATYDDGPLHRALADAVAADLLTDLATDLLPAAAPSRRPARVVLDVGTGTGLVLRALTHALAGQDPDHLHEVRLIGIDLSPAMLRIATAATPTAAYLRADATALPLADSSVDVLTCVTALHLLPSPEAADAAIAEWRRVLRPGGHVHTATFGPTPSSVPAPVPVPAQDLHRRHDAYATPDQLAAAFAPHGLRLDHGRTRTWTDGEHHLLLSHAVPATGPVPAAPLTSQ